MATVRRRPRSFTKEHDREKLRSTLEHIAYCHVFDRHRNMSRRHGRSRLEWPPVGSLASTCHSLRQRIVHRQGIHRYSRRHSDSPLILEDSISVGRLVFRRGRAGGDASEHSHIWQWRLVLLHWMVLQQGARCISRLCYRPASSSCAALSITATSFFRLRRQRTSLAIFVIPSMPFNQSSLQPTASRPCRLSRGSPARGIRSRRLIVF